MLKFRLHHYAPPRTMKGALTDTSMLHIAIVEVRKACKTLCEFNRVDLILQIVLS